MRILLVQPKAQLGPLGFHIIALPEPLALEILAATVPDDEVSILDMRIDDDLLGAIDSFAPDLVAVTALTTEVYAAQEVLSAVKARAPEVFTVVGGHHATLVPHDFFLPSVDAIGLGEGEAVFPQLVEALKRGRQLKEVPNLIWRDGDGEFLANGRSVPDLDMDALPQPRRDLVRRYRPEYFMLVHRPESSVATGRGCPYRCNFCSVWEFYQGKTRQMSPGRVVEELRGIETEHLTFVDDNFIFAGRRELEIAQRIKAEGIRRLYSMECRTDAIVRHPELIPLWAELGLRSVLLGLEGADDGRLASLNKRNAARTNEEAVRILQANGVNVWGAFIVDPDWTADDFQALRDYVLRLELSLVQFTVLTPLPGTQLYRENHARLLTHDYTCFDTLHAVLPTRLPREEFYRRFAGLYHRPDPKPYFDLIDRGVWTLEQLKLAYRKSKTMQQWELYAENDPVLRQKDKATRSDRCAHRVKPASSTVGPRPRLLDDSAAVDEGMRLEARANDTILARLFHHAQLMPDRTVYTFLRDGAAPETITYGELHDRVLCLAHGFRERAEPGDRALLVYPSGLEFIAAFLGCLAAGIIAVPAQLPRRNRPSERLQHIAADADPKLILTSTRVLRSHGSLDALNSTGQRMVLATEDLSNGHPPDLRWPLPEPEAIAFLQYTSGSTGNPRGVIVTHGNIANNEATIQAEFGHTRDSIGCLWLPLFHDMGLIGGVLQPLFAGFPTVLLAPEAFIQQPVEWLRAIGRYRATTAGAPNFAYDYCVARVSEEQKHALDLSSVKVLFDGAEPVQAETLNRFTRAFAQCGLHPDAVYPCYGLAESTLLVSGGPREEPPRRLWVGADGLETRVVRSVQAGHPGSRCLVSSGRPTSGTRLAIVDPDSRVELPSGRIGEVWVNSESVCQGYWNKPAETRETFQAVLHSGDNGFPFLRTGDLGFLESGYLFVTGRIKDLIIIHGRNVYPHDVEAAVQRALDFLPPNSCAAFSAAVHGEERLALVIEVTRAMAGRLRQNGQDNGSRAEHALAEMRQLVARLQTAVAEEFSVAIHSVAFVRPGAFPRTSSGKVQRRICREQLAAGTLDAIFQWNDGHCAVRGAPDCAVRGSPDPAQGRPKASLKRRRPPVGPVGGVERPAPSAPSCQPETQIVAGDHDGQRRRELRELVLRVLTDYFRRHKGVDPGPIDFHTSLLTLGVDSLGAAAIALEIERATGRTLTPDIIFEYQTVDQLAGYLDRHPGPCAVRGSPDPAQGRPKASLKRRRPPVGPIGEVGRPAPSAPGPAPSAPSAPEETPAPESHPPDRAASFLQSLAERNRAVETLKKQNQYFFETPISRFNASTCEVDGREMLMFSSFSYLGLVGHPEVNQAAIDAIQRFGGGAHGARLIAGTTVLHQELEARIARFMEADAALVFGTGYVTNLGVIQALVGKQDYVVGDAWNHASIADGCAFSAAEFAAYAHNDMDHLERCLKGSRGRHTLVVVDAVYSMEGDIAPLPDIVRLCRQYDALLMVDEAHSLGVLGTTGRGVQEHFGLPPDAIDVKMGTLSKGLASQGGFVAGREEIITFLKYNARGFVFSTAPPAPGMAAAMKALEILQREPERVETLRRNAARLLEGLHALGLKTTRTQTPIIPVLCETMEKTLAMTAFCRENGLFVVPVFYPVVPMNSPRIRLNVTAAHSEAEIDKALDVLGRAAREAGLTP